jgi:hypothetical protein
MHDYNLRQRRELNYSEDDYYRELFDEKNDDDDDAYVSLAKSETSKTSETSEYVLSDDNMSDDDTSDLDACFSGDENVSIVV